MAQAISTPEVAAEGRWDQAEEEWLRRCGRRIVGRSPRLLEALRVAYRASIDGDCTVLLTGETGTGKELVARAIHGYGRRSRFPFQAVNCATLLPSLAESLLFGHERGAYTGANATTRGLFRQCHGGTVLLDEVQELAPEVQAKVLRFAQDGEVVPVGGETRRTVDVRIIAGSNCDLRAAVADGAFRADLYFRLNVVPVTLPPLRARREDIPLLVDHFLTLFNAEKGHCVVISPEAMAALAVHDWPGNVRELRNVVERLVILVGDGVVRPEDLRLGPGAPGTATAPGSPVGPIRHHEARTETVSTFERDFLRRQLAVHGWHITQTAATIGRSRQWLTRRIHHYGLQRTIPV